VAEVALGFKKKLSSAAACLKSVHEADVFYFLNSPRGRAAAEAFQRAIGAPRAGEARPIERPNIFKLYEENIGPLTPIIADMLREAEKEYRNECSRRPSRLP